MKTLVKKSTDVVAELKQQLQQDPVLADLLTVSLTNAVVLAENKLNADLFRAINNEFYGNGWPTSIGAYLDYLSIYVRMIPNESNDPLYPDAWTSDDQANGYNQKIYDLLCQFYWLIDQPDENGDTLQDYVSPDGWSFANWLVDFANAWGDFLDTPESLTPESLSSFKYDYMYNFPLYAENEPNWTTFNQFFSRQFNGADPRTGITPLRPIAEPEKNTTIVSPADCTYKMVYSIDGQGNVLDEAGQPTRFRLKHTHSIGNINDLLDGSPYASRFYGGTFVHYFLSPFDYHRFHTPVAGSMVECRAVAGKVYLNVEMSDDGQFDAPDGAEDGYEFVQSRGIVIVDTGDAPGMVATIPIGMCQVSGVDMYHDIRNGKDAIPVQKGEEFGSFYFGGSDIILLFEPSNNLYLWKNDPGNNPIHFQYGQAAAYWNS